MILEQLKKLLTCFSQAELTQIAEQVGFTIRLRNIMPLDFILSLITALGGDGNATTLADLHRKFNELTGCNVTYRSWINQPKKDTLPTLILWLWFCCLELFSRKVLAFDENSPFSDFEHIYIHDGSSQAVYKALEDVFPGRFSRISPAAVEIHTTMDLLNDNLVRVQLTEDTRSERACLPSSPSSLALTV
ncbi:transposase [Spongorhabdus nitratireducens]